MIADLYISNDTFSHNGIDSIKDVKKKLSDFQIMMEKVVQHSEDNILYLIKEDFASTVVFDDGKSINEILSNYRYSVDTYGKDVLTIFNGIFKHCQSSTATIDEMKDFLNLDDENNCSAIIVLNPLQGYEEHVQVLSSVNGWFKFRRYFLAKYPGEVDFFLNESKKYFTNIHIHESTKTTLRDVLDSHPKQIVAYLSVLNDSLITDFKNFGGKDLNAFLPWFAGKYHLDGASFDGKKDDKFNFDFPDGTKAYCEPHLKMYKDDAGNQNQHCRIHFKKPNEGETIVYVGRICCHM